MSPTPDVTIAPGFLTLLIWIAVLGSIGLIGGNVVGSIVVPNHDFVADTVSDLAAGKYEIIQDVALYGFAVSLLALGLACAHLHTCNARWSVLTIALVMLAVAVVIIGARNEYGDADNEGIVIHIYVVYALGVLFTIVFTISALDGGRIADFLPTLSWVCLGLWVIGAPLFFVMSTAWDGLWERGLGVICVVWTIAFAYGLHGYVQARR